MICRVSNVHGTFGINRDGKVSGILPMSETVGTVKPAAMTKPVSTIIVTSGAGITLVSLGKKIMITTPKPTSG